MQLFESSLKWKAAFNQAVDEISKLGHLKQIVAA